MGSEMCIRDRVTFNWDNFPELRGDVAESWNVSKDGLTYTFKIRKGIKFHDGTPLTAKDVKATYDRLYNPPEGVRSARKNLFSSIKSIETPDDFTVVFKLKSPDGALLTGFGSPWNSIYSAKDIAKGPRWHADNINGTGPFRFVEHVKGSKWVAKRYEDYHFDDNYLDGTVGFAIKKIVNPMLGGQLMAECSLWLQDACLGIVQKDKSLISVTLAVLPSLLKVPGMWNTSVTRAVFQSPTGHNGAVCLNCPRAG